MPALFNASALTKLPLEVELLAGGSCAMSLMLRQKAEAKRMIGGSVNRRKSVRFELQTPVTCRFHDDQSNPQEIGGLSRDVSRTGIFVFSPTPPSEGTAITVAVLLPALGRVGGDGLQLTSEGAVVRTEHGITTGFAVRCDFGSIDNLRLNSPGTQTRS